MNKQKSLVITRHAITKDCKMSVDLTFRAATALKAMNAKPAEGKHYICILLLYFH